MSYPSSSNFLLGPIPAMTYSPNCILHMIVENGSPVIVQWSNVLKKWDRLAEPMRDVSRYRIRLEAAHTILAQACLGVLLRLDECVHRNSIKDFPLVRYAAQYWHTHARVKNVSSRIKNGMECLFDAEKPYLATWLWIYDRDEWERYWGCSSMSTEHPKKPAAVPLYYAASLGLRDFAEHLIGPTSRACKCRRRG
jgi:hypothetical protein